MMPNKNYVKGRKKEYQIKQQLEREGFIVLRTAGSHGFADLIAISEEKGLIRFIQCKPYNFSESSVSNLMADNSHLNNSSLIWKTTFEVI